MMGEVAIQRSKGSDHERAIAPRVGQRDSRSTDVHSRDLQEMAQGRTHGSRVSMAADLQEAMKLCFISGGSVLAAVIHPISHLRFFHVATTEGHLASDVRIAGGRSMVSVTGKEKRCSARGDPGKRLGRLLLYRRRRRES
ncbi:hypothetical protein NE237_018119 [Protea cynaroides]|uniref:Uncharacterized protein n=1 Tax=Protea cynaroides TaxID=273540 RepID=A0A9Q0QNP2_9MAGN|nr:hypothetical protein NE237_018119 [Protea cynaroides]